jgi:hypothetical protein
MTQSKERPGGFGWLKDPYDHRDFIHKPKLIKIPDNVNWGGYLPDVRDQGYIGSCVGFGIGANLSAWAKKLGIFIEWFSPTWIYNGARFIEGTLPYDDGCWPRDALDWLVRKGGLLEHFWPYDPYSLDTTSPPSKFDPEAAKYPLSEYVTVEGGLGYYRVTGGADGIMSALADGYFVSIGTPWFWDWTDTDLEGNLPVITEKSEVAGGHETILYGYDKNKKRFLGMNSWGDGWGNYGMYTMPFSSFDVFNKLGGYDAHYIKVDWAEVPPEPEPPEPVPPEPTPGQIRIRLQWTLDGGASWMNILDIPIAEAQRLLNKTLRRKK